MDAQPLTETKLMTVDEFVRRYETDGPFEIINGEYTPMSPVVAGHSNKARIIHDALAAHNRQTDAGVSFFEQAYVLIYDQNWVKGARQPDIAYYRIERWQAYIQANPDWEEKPLVIVPDVVVEIISRNDTYAEVDAKVERYLEDGVQRVWVVDPKQQCVIVRGQDYYRKLRLDDVLTGEDIIPGFTLAVKAVFA